MLAFSPASLIALSGVRPLVLHSSFQESNRTHPFFGKKAAFPLFGTNKSEEE